MKILVTGGAGYVGSILISDLIKQHDVVCLDRFFFGKNYLSQEKFTNKVELIQDDIRWFNPKILENIDLVIDLAAMSNDPSGELHPRKTFDINHLGRTRVAKLSKKFGVKRYILASSASVYGFQEKIVNEESTTNPLTTYSKSARLAELDILPLDDDNFTVTVLRFGTLFGVSPRMRFDLGTNAMIYSLFDTGKIIVDGDGKQKRAVLHVKDASHVYQTIINAPEEKIKKQIFNGGSDDLNYDINEVAQQIGESTGKSFEIEHKGTNDLRSYTASFAKIKEILNFSPKYSIKDGVDEIYQGLDSGAIKKTKKTITLEWYKHLISSPELTDQVKMYDTIL